MLKVTTAKEMQDIDGVTIQRYGVAGIVLMERAGLAVVSKINEFYPDKKVVVLCGGGNNGGDGFVIARVLHNQGRKVEVYAASGPGKLKGDAKVNYDSAKKFGVIIHPVRKFLSHGQARFSQRSLIVDALLGTGLSREVRAPLSDAIRKVNRLSSPVVAVDIPSGVSSDTGQVMGCAVKARHTVTFGLPKRGHLLYPGAEYAGRLYIEDIGFPQRLLHTEKIKTHLVRNEDAVSLLPERPKYSHKGTYGHVLLVAGSRGKTGAALMAAKACLKGGAGLVTIGVPETLINTFQARVTEEMLLPLPDKGDGTIALEAYKAIIGFLKNKGTVLAIGPGLSVNDEISKLVGMLVKESGVPVVIDADGLNAIAGKTGVLKKGRAPVVLTPHPGEMARLLKKRSAVSGQQSAADIRKQVEEDRIGTVISFAKRTETYVVLKGVPTVTASPEGNAYINSTGNPGMAAAGMGDVLTGLVSAFLAQKLDPARASVLAVHIHGFAGDIAAGRKGERSLMASDIIHTLPRALKLLSSCK